MEQINPYKDEQMTVADEIRAELERLERQKVYLEELLEHYE